MDGLGGFADFSIVENSAKLLDALNRLDGQKLRKVFSKRDERGYTLLHVATERNQTESLKCLVIKNMDVNVRATPASNEMTPLHVAVMCGHLACLQLLVQSGGDIMAQDSNKLTASDYAIREGQMFCLNYLDEQIAKKQQEEKNILSTLLEDIEKCFGRGEYDTIASLEHFNDFFQTSNEETKADIVSRRCSLINSREVVKVFGHISKDVPVLLHGASILHMACYHGNVDLVKLLLIRYPQMLHTTTSEGYDPLHIASMHRQLNIAQLLILTQEQLQLSRLQGPAMKEEVLSEEEGTHQDSLGSSTASGHTSLHFAVANSDIAMVTELVKHLKELKFPIDASGCGYTPLHMAVLLRHTHIISILLRKGANPNLRIDKGMLDRLRIGATPLAEAVLGESGAILDLLLEHGAEDRQHEALKLCFKSPNHSSSIPHLMGTLLRVDDGGLKERRKGVRTKPVLVDWSGLQLKAFDLAWLTLGVTKSMFFRNQSIASRNTLELVTTLNISSNQLSSLPWELFSCLPKLSILNASSNCLKSLPDPTSSTEGTCECITRLDFSKNQLTAVPDYIFQLPNLSVLDLSDNKIISLPPLVWSSPKLHNLNCSKNKLEAIPVPIMPIRTPVTSSPAPTPSSTPHKAAALKRTSVDVEVPHFLYPDRDIPLNSVDSPIAEITPISKLEDRLNICNGNVPIDWDQSKEKEEVNEGLSLLNLSHNQIRVVPDSLPCLCPKLVRLDLSHNEIESVALPKSLPSSLKQLTMSHNPISELDSERPVPKPLPCCNPLVCRESSGGEEGTFCQHRRHHHLLHLTILDFSNCALQLVNLYSHAKGRTSDDQSLIAAIANTQAQKNYRNLEAFAKLVCPLLTRLVLSQNMLDKVPASVCDMTTLNSLDLSFNNIIDLPAALGKLSNLWEFPLAGLKLISPPHNIIERGKTKDIIGFLWSLLQRARPYHRMKLMFTGKAAMGKTSLLEKISERGQRGHQENWALTRMMAREGVNKEKLSTVGIVVSDWTYYKKVHESQTALKSITFMTWDFGGQEEYYATHQCFISRRALYIVVWNMVKGMSGVKDLKPWLLNIQARAPHSPVIIVGTHLDQIKTRAQRAEKQECNAYIANMYGSPGHAKEGYPQIMGIEEVSSKTGKNIDNLRGLIFDVASMVKENTVSGRGLGCGRIPEYRLLMDQLVPASYLQLEDTVRNIALAMRARKKPPVLTYKELRDWVFADPSTLISKNSEDRELEQAVRFLHDNGTMLHYEDPILSNLYFVDPQWLVDMLAHIVTVREINPLVKEGIMKTSDFGLIFQEEEFPISWKKEYIRLLTTFEVAVELGENELLIPSVLPEIRPILPQAVGPPNLKLLPPLHHTYVVPFVPSGLWPRLMSRILTDPKIKQLAIDGCGLTSEKAKDSSQLNWFKWRQGIIYRYEELNLMEVEELQEKMFEGCSVELYKDEIWKTSDAAVFGIDVKVHDIYPILKYNEGQVVGGASGDSVGGAYDGVVGGATGDSVGGAYDGVVGGATGDSVDGASDGAGVGAPIGTVGGASDGAGVGAPIGTVGGASDGAGVGAPIGTVGGASLPTQGEGVNMDNLESEFAKVTTTKMAVHSGLLMTLGGGGGGGGGGEEKVSSLPEPSPSSPGPPKLSEDCFDQMRAGLLSKVVEHISLLIDDWFVGVRPRSIVVPCPHCTAAKPKGPVLLERSFSTLHSPSPSNPFTQGTNRVTRYVFDYDDCVVAARSRDYVECPDHGKLPLAYIAPDTLFLTQGKDILVNEKDIFKEDVLGKGAFATVFKAKVKTGSKQYRDVALKALTKEWHQADQSVDDAHDAEAVQEHHNTQPTRYSIVEGFNNLKKELSILCQLKHSHIVELYGVLLRPLGLVLELASKGSLKHICKEYNEKQTKLCSNVSQAVIKQVSSALTYLHSRDIIYRDCKTDNVLVCRFPDPHDSTPRGISLDTNTVLVKLSDYGISQFAATQGARGLVGTPGFMAPEILKYHGREVYNCQVDIFSLAMLIYEMITLHQPYENLTAQQANQSNENGARPSLCRKDLPCPVLLRELMAWCWQQNPGDRPTASQIVKTVNTDQFLRLLDGIRVCDTTHVIACGYRIVSTYSRMSSGQRSLPGGGRRNSPTTLSCEPLREYSCSSHHQTKLASLSEEDPVQPKVANGLEDVVDSSAAMTTGMNTSLHTPATAPSYQEQPNDDQVRPKHPCPDDVIVGPSPNENSSPASQYGDDDVICELWVVSSDGHHSVATVIDFTGRFVNTEDIDLGDTPVRCVCMVGDKVWVGFGIGCLLIYEASSRHVCAQVWVKHLTAINHIVHIPSLKRVYIALDNGSVLSYSENPPQLATKSPLLNLTILPEAHYHDNLQIAASLLPVPVLGTNGVTHEIWVGQRSMITILNPLDLSVIEFVTMSTDPSHSPSYVSYLVYAHLVCSMTFEQAFASYSNKNPELSKGCVNVYGSSYHGHYVMRWNCLSRSLVQSLDCRQHMQDNDCYISTLHYSSLQLFVGMTTGGILILDALDLSCLCILHCHCSQTKALLVLDLATMQQDGDMARERAEVRSSSSSPAPVHKVTSYTSLQPGSCAQYLLSFGTGFKSYFEYKSEQRPYANSAYLLVWDSEHWKPSK